MVVAIQNTPSGYVPPSRHALANRLLESADAQLTQELADRDENNDLARKFGVTYSSDGWDSCDNLPLINSCYMLANDGGIYLRSVDTSGFSKTAEYCASLMIADIYEIGCTKVVCVCTDTCSTMSGNYRR